MKNVVKANIAVFLSILTINLQALTILVPKAPPAIVVVKALENSKDIKVHFYKDVISEVIPKIVREKEYLYVLPVNLAAKLHNRGKKLKIVTVTTMGLLSAVSTDKNINRVEDFDGKRVYIGSPGSSPDIIARYFFKRYKIKPQIVYSSSPEIAKMMIAGKVKYAILPEPFASFVIGNGDGKRVSDLRRDWKELHSQSDGMPQAVIVCSENVYKKYSKEIGMFQSSLETAVLWVNKNPEKASLLGVEKIGFSMDVKAIENAISTMNLVSLSGKKAEEEIRCFLRKLISIEPKSVGGKIPDDSFFKR